MTDPKRPDETPHFETDEVSASRGREQGLGVGARELAAQRDPDDLRSRDDEDARLEAGDDDADGGDAETLDQSFGVQGDDKDASPARDAI